jgi:hypothetical protein
MVLRPKPSNRSASSVLHTRPPPSDACYLHGQHGHSHVFSRLSMSQVSASAASHPASGSLGPSLMSVLHPSSPSARHVLLDLHLTVGYRLRAPHLHNTSQETCRTQGFRQGRVSHHSTYFVDHIDNHSSQNKHTRVLVNLVFANFLVSYMLSLLMLLILIWGLCFRQLLVDYWIRMFEVSRRVGVLVPFFLSVLHRGYLEPFNHCPCRVKGSCLLRKAGI